MLSPGLRPTSDLPRVRCSWSDVGSQDQYSFMFSWGSHMQPGLVTAYRSGALASAHTASRHRERGLQRGVLTPHPSVSQEQRLLLGVLEPRHPTGLPLPPSTCFSSFPRLSCLSSPPPLTTREQLTQRRFLLYKALAPNPIISATATLREV